MASRSVPNTPENRPIQQQLPANENTVLVLSSNQDSTYETECMQDNSDTLLKGDNISVLKSKNDLQPFIPKQTSHQNKTSCGDAQQYGNQPQESYNMTQHAENSDLSGSNQFEIHKQSFDAKNKSQSVNISAGARSKQTISSLDKNISTTPHQKKTVTFDMGSLSPREVLEPTFQTNTYIRNTSNDVTLYPESAVEHIQTHNHAEIKSQTYNREREINEDLSCNQSTESSLLSELPIHIHETTLHKNQTSNRKIDINEDLFCNQSTESSLLSELPTHIHETTLHENQTTNRENDVNEDLFCNQSTEST